MTMEKAMRNLRISLLFRLRAKIAREKIMLTAVAVYAVVRAKRRTILIVVSAFAIWEAAVHGIPGINVSTTIIP